MKFIRLTVEQVEEDKHKPLHLDFVRVECGATVERTVRVMLAKAALKFQDPPKTCVQRHD